MQEVEMDSTYSEEAIEWKLTWPWRGHQRAGEREVVHEQYGKAVQKLSETEKNWGGKHGMKLQQ